MSVFRVEKNKGYTVMSNHHLRNHTLSLKAKGLLSQMLSLPDDWDYTLQGLAQINKESIDAIREAVRELERAGYIKRSRERDERGCLRGTVYTIYEQPHAEPTPEEPTQEKPALDNPTLEKPMSDKPTLENPTQLNTESTKKRKRQSKDSSITDSIPFPSGFPDVTAQKRTEAKESFERYRDLILENIDYDVLANDPHVDREQLDEIVALVQETVCSTRSRIRVAGNDYPAEVVRSKLLKLLHGESAANSEEHELNAVFLQITLAISLHASNQEKRKELMPIAYKYDIHEVLDATRYYFGQTGRRITFEYSLVSGVNDNLDEAKALVNLIKDQQAHVNLIPVNPIKERNYVQSNQKAIQEFKGYLEKHGINVTVRREMGRDIGGACGQLRKSYMDQKKED